MSLSLTDALRKIKGVGPKIETQLNALNIFTIEDLIFHLPIRYENKTQLNEIKDLDQNQNAHVEGEIVESKIFFPGRRSFLAKITDGTITAAKLATANIDRSLNVDAGNLGINNTITAATRSGITYNAQGLITATAALVAGDLPVATASAVGGVSVGTGLSVDGSGVLALSNSVTAATVSGITFNAQGQITAATNTGPAKHPRATSSIPTSDTLFNAC